MTSPLKGGVFAAAGVLSCCLPCSNRGACLTLIAGGVYASVVRRAYSALLRTPALMYALDRSPSGVGTVGYDCCAARTGYHLRHVTYAATERACTTRNMMRRRRASHTIAATLHNTRAMAHCAYSIPFCTSRRA